MKLPVLRAVSRASHLLPLPQWVERLRACVIQGQPLPGPVVARVESRLSERPVCTCCIAAADTLRRRDSCPRYIRLPALPQTPASQPTGPPCSASLHSPSLLPSPLQQPGCCHVSRKSKSKRKTLLLSEALINSEL